MRRAERRVVDQLEVGVLGLLVRGLVGDEVGLEGRHPVLAEERRAGPGPEVVEEVDVGASVARGTRAARRARRVEQRLATLPRSPSTSSASELALGVTRHAAVEDDVLVARRRHRARDRRRTSCRATGRAPESYERLRRRSRHACSRGSSLYGSAQSIVGQRPCRASGACRGRRGRRCPPRDRSDAAALDARSSSPHASGTVCPSSLNWMIAAAFCIRAISCGSRSSSPLDWKRSTGSSP